MVRSTIRPSTTAEDLIQHLAVVAIDSILAIFHFLLWILWNTLKDYLLNGTKTLLINQTPQLKLFGREYETLN